MKTRLEKIRLSARQGFTLVELMVVMVIIMILIAGTLNIATNFTAQSAYNQSYNLMSALLAETRATAFESRSYRALCVETLEVDGRYRCYASVMKYDETNNKFILADSESMREFPEGLAFGKLNADTCDSSGLKISPSNLKNFSNFIIVFSPEGKVITKVNGSSIKWDLPMHSNLQDDGLLTNSIDSSFLTSTRSEEGTQAFMLLNYQQAYLLGENDATSFKNYLEQDFEFITMNRHTGLVMSNN